MLFDNNKTIYKNMLLLRYLLGENMPWQRHVTSEHKSEKQRGQGVGTYNQVANKNRSVLPLISLLRKGLWCFFTYFWIKINKCQNISYNLFLKFPSHITTKTEWSLYNWKGQITTISCGYHWKGELAQTTRDNFFMERQITRHNLF